MSHPDLGGFFNLFIGFFILFGVVFVLGFVLFFGTLVYAVARGVTQWASNNQQPVLSVPARVVTKRTQTRGAGDGPVSTRYYVTFEWESGERREFSIRDQVYGLLAEGDRGILTSQGTRYLDFQRHAG